MQTTARKGEQTYCRPSKTSIARVPEGLHSSQRIHCILFICLNPSCRGAKNTSTVLQNHLLYEQSQKKQQNEQYKMLLNHQIQCINDTCWSHTWLCTSVSLIWLSIIPFPKHIYKHPRSPYSYQPAATITLIQLQLNNDRQICHLTETRLEQTKSKKLTENFPNAKAWMSTPDDACVASSFNVLIMW